MTRRTALPRETAPSRHPPAGTAPPGGVSSPAGPGSPVLPRPPLEPQASGVFERRAAPIAFALLVLLFVQGLMFITESSQTSDEAVHLAAGYSYLMRGDFRLNPEHPPLLKQIAALPLLALDLGFPDGPLWESAEQWNLGQQFVHENRVTDDTLLFLGRLPMLALSILLGACLFSWGRRLFGARGALLSLALYVSDPNVVAHSCLVTTDLGFALFFFLTVWAIWLWVERPAPVRLALAGAACGAAFAAKFTALWLLPVLGGLALVLLLTDAPLPLRPWSPRGPLAGREHGLPRRGAALAVAGLLMLAIAAVVLLASYGVVGIDAYARGLAAGLKHSGEGHMAYLMGEYSRTGWWYYFLFAYLIKTPIGTLVILLAAAVAACLGRLATRRNEWFLILPVALVVAITGLWKVNIGLRHLLPAYPFLYLAAGRLLSPATATPRPALRLPAIVAAVGLAWNGVEAARIAPYQLAYFNDFAGGPAGGHRYLLDSNLDWGQGAKALHRFMMERGVPALYCGFSGNSDPWYDGVRYQYAPGTGNLNSARRHGILLPDDLPRVYIAVSAMTLHAVHFIQHDAYAWLREREPVARPGYAYFVYDITGDVESHASLAVLYANFGVLDLAEAQARRVLRMDPENLPGRAVLERLAEVPPH